MCNNKFINNKRSNSLKKYEIINSKKTIKSFYSQFTKLNRSNMNEK